MTRHSMFSRPRKAVAAPATAFLLRATAWFVGLLGVLRLPWVQTRLLLPYTEFQARVAERLLGEKLQVFVAGSCSGSDAMAVCVGAILAFPAPWRRRLLAAAGGLAVITVVNTVRIAHLSKVSPDRELLELMHLRVWPAMIILVAAGYAFAWMSVVTKPPKGETGAGRSRLVRLPAWTVIIVAAAFVTAYYMLYDLLLESAFLGAAAARTASMAGGLMGFCGVQAEVSGGIMRAGSATWAVTPECVTTPLVPIALAAVLVARVSWRVRLAALLALPLAFQALAVARLMVLAVPRVLIGSPAIAVHAFYQVLLALALIAWLAGRRGDSSDSNGGSKRGPARVAATAIGVGALTGLAVGILDLRALRPAISHFSESLHLGHSYVDPQGVLALLPAFQLGLLTALWTVGRPHRRLRELWLPATLTAVAGASTLLLLGELSAHAAIEAPVVLLRGWSLALPPLLAASAGWLERSPSDSQGAGRRAESPTP